MNWLFFYFHYESKESFGAYLHLHVLLPLVIVERSEELHWRGHLECSGEDSAAVANSVKEIEMILANAMKRNYIPINHIIK